MSRYCKVSNQKYESREMGERLTGKGKIQTDVAYSTTIFCGRTREICCFAAVFAREKTPTTGKYCDTRVGICARYISMID